jgi:hypothetical protein
VEGEKKTDGEKTEKDKNKEMAMKAFGFAKKAYGLQKKKKSR